MKICFDIRNIFFLILELIIINSSLIISEVRYVSKTGSSAPPYTSWATASDSIQKCINISNFGDTIYVGKGNYKEIIVMRDGLSLIGVGMDSCVIDMTKLYIYVRAVTMKDSCLLQGFNIKFSRSFPYEQGVGVYVSFLDTTKGCRILDNKIENAETGIVATEGIIRHNILINCKWAILLDVFDLSRDYYAEIDSNFISFWYKGIRVSTETKVRARGNIFNTSFWIDPILKNDILTGNTYTEFHNNLILKPEGDSLLDVAIYNFYPGIFTNNVFLAKYKKIFYTAPITVKNNIAIGSKNAILGDTTNVKYNNFWKMDKYPKDSTNISVDPMFVNDNNDFKLQKYSPMIDAGDPAILDKDGTRSDIGLYGGLYGMSYEYVDLAPRIPVNFHALVDTNIITLKWNKNTEADFRNYKLYRDTVPNFTLSPEKIISETEDTSFIDIIQSVNHNYYYKVTASDNQGNESQASAEVSVIYMSIKTYPHLISDYRLYQNYPNPFNSTTKIGYRLPKRGSVKIYVYDTKGESIAVVENIEREAGYYEAEFRAEEKLSSGVYLYRIDITDSEKRVPVFSNMQKMIIIK